MLIFNESSFNLINNDLRHFNTFNVQEIKVINSNRKGVKTSQNTKKNKQTRKMMNCKLFSPVYLLILVTRDLN